MKRVRKAKADGIESVANSDDGPNREQIPGAQSVLEISGPTIPSPGPSGTAWSLIVISLVTFMGSVKAARAQELGRGVDGLWEVRWMFVFPCSFEQVAGGITQVLAGRDQRSASEREG